MYCETKKSNSHSNPKQSYLDPPNFYDQRKDATFLFEETNVLHIQFISEICNFRQTLHL